MRSRLLHSFGILIFVALMPYIAHSQYANVDQRPNSDNSKELKKRKALIEDELRQANRFPWAGKYNWGYIGYAGSILHVAPKSGFVYEPYIDYASDIVNAFDYGEVKVSDDGTLSFFPKLGRFAGGNYYFMKWGERHFLVPVHQVPSFINYSNLGCDQFANYPDVVRRVFPSKDNELRRRLFGFPEVPVQFQSLLLTSPVNVAIKSVGARTLNKRTPNSANWEWETTVTIDKGGLDGLWPGMILFLIDSRGVGGVGYAMVRSTSDHSAEARITDGFRAEEPPLPIIGGKLISRLDPKWYERYSRPSVCW